MRFFQLIALIAILALAGALGWRYYQLENLPREPLPALTLEPVMDLPAFGDLATGEPALLHFWGAACAPCRAEHALLMALRDEGIAIYGIASDESALDSANFLAELGNPYLGSMRDVEGQSAQALLVETYPTTFILSADGEMVGRVDGPIDVSVLRNEIYPVLDRES
ncbi:MAG: redoxin domain-containing protein [Alphaproteobacteria bacterium]|nr:redoxin domain-containing protein [Alphaproteobacteria bacterium]